MKAIQKMTTNRKRSKQNKKSCLMCCTRNNSLKKQQLTILMMTHLQMAAKRRRKIWKKWPNKRKLVKHKKLYKKPKIFTAGFKLYKRLIGKLKQSIEWFISITSPYQASSLSFEGGSGWADTQVKICIYKSNWNSKLMARWEHFFKFHNFIFIIISTYLFNIWNYWWIIVKHLRVKNLQMEFKKIYSKRKTKKRMTITSWMIWMITKKTNCKLGCLEMLLKAKQEANLGSKLS
jgi:hypothetical protein